MNQMNFDLKITRIKELMGENTQVIVRTFRIGRDKNTRAATIYLNSMVDKNIIDRDILNPLMLNINENLPKQNIDEYILERYILVCNAVIQTELSSVIEQLKRGKTLFFTDCSDGYIIMDTTQGIYRSITEPLNEVALKGSHEGFIENIETNISIIKRWLKDSNLVIEHFIIGKRSQTDVILVYIKDIIDMDIVKEARKRLNAIDVDITINSDVIMQYIEDYTYSIFPQMLSSERPDTICSNIRDGRFAILASGSSSAIVGPSFLEDFFKGVEDFYQRTIVSSFTRLLRYIAAFIVITLPSIYLVLLKYNAELIPIKLVVPLAQSRQGIPFTPIVEILIMEIIVDFLREGGLRLPSKVGQTLNVVGGIIIGTSAIEARIVSPSTLLIIGITSISAFLIPNYDMSIAIKIIRLPMLILANYLGILGLIVGWFFIIVNLLSLESFGVPYFSFNFNEMKNMLIRTPLWNMNKRPKQLDTSDNIKQTNFRNKWNKGE